MEIKRNHKAITYEPEKKLLDKVAGIIYLHTTADQLSLLALLGALLTGSAYILSQYNLGLLHVANIGILLHWFGDSLDGRVARNRKESRPKYGHYLDHILDSISLVIIIFGITYSGLTLTTSWVWVLSLFLLIMIHSFLKASVTGEFDLSIERIGPTEARIGLIMVNLVILLTNNTSLVVFPFPATVFDVVGLVTAFVLLVNFGKTVYLTLWGPNKIKES